MNLPGDFQLNVCCISNGPPVFHIVGAGFVVLTGFSASLIAALSALINACVMVCFMLCSDANHSFIKTCHIQVC